MGYTINEAMLRQFRVALGVHEDVGIVSTGAGAERITLEEQALYADNAVSDFKMSPESFALILAVAAYNSDVFRRTALPGGPYTYGAVTQEEVQDFANWLKGRDLVRDAKSVVEASEPLGKPKYAWQGAVWRVETGYTVDDFLADGAPNRYIREALMLRALEMIEVDGSDEETLTIEIEKPRDRRR